MQHKFLFVQRLTQLGFKGEFSSDRFGHVLCVKQNALTTRFGFFERCFRVLKKRVSLRAVFRKNCNACLDTDAEYRVV